MEPKFSRYERQIQYSAVGLEGQVAASKAKVVLIGCGALGSVLAEILVRAGIGSLIIADRDVVERSNLQRQSLFTEKHAEKSTPKAIAAKEVLSNINSDVNVTSYVTHVDAKFLDTLEKGDLVLDGTDNFRTRLLLNDYCFRESIPWIHGACIGSYGVAAAFLPGKTACFHCLFGADLPLGAETCETAGILGPVVHAVAAQQAMAALRILTGNGDSIRPVLTSFDLWKGTHQTISIGPDAILPNCRCCQQKAFDFLTGCDGQQQVLCGRDTVQILPAIPDDSTFNLEEWARNLPTNSNPQTSPILVRLSDGDCRLSIFPDARMLVHGTSDPQRAQALYNKWIGG